MSDITKVKNYLVGFGIIMGSVIGYVMYMVTGDFLYWGAGIGIGLILGAGAQMYLTDK